MEDVILSEELWRHDVYDERQRNEKAEIFEVPAPYTSLQKDELDLKNLKSAIHEGQYIYYDSESKEVEPAYNNPLAISRRIENFKMRNGLIGLSGRNDQEGNPKSLFSKNAQVVSYHVNVGHGNCTLILIREGVEYGLWMVDCGGIDLINKQCYYSNISACLTEIANELKISQANLRISKFFLTHWHYDHISGLLWLIRQGMIDSRTLCFMNLYYGHSSKCANEVLRELYRLKVKCYEPTAALRTIPEVAILHPECRIRKWATPRDGNYRIVSKMNNTSVVYSITIGNDTMVLPGDLEREGWDAMTSATTCQIRPLCVTNYYCVSHHSSITGHVDIPCLGNSHFPNVGVCLQARNLCRAILMGRNGAYNGIYNPIVIQYWTPMLSLSECDGNGQTSRAAVLEWDTGGMRWIY